MGPRHCRLPWRRLVAGWDQADAHVETVQARGVEVAAEQSEVGSWARPCGLDQHPVARRGDANHGPARIAGQVLGQRLHVALPDGGLVDPIRVDLRSLRLPARYRVRLAPSSKPTPPASAD